MEHWFRDSEAASFSPSHDTFHPHITLVRPFEPRFGEDEIRKSIVNFCRGKGPIAFCLEGKGNFGEIQYIPVIGADLLQFANQLEEILVPSVNFVPKLDDKKTLHLTVKTSEEIDPFPRTESHMLRLTVIRDKKIWFSYDFVTQEVLNREQSLDKNRWYKTVRMFHDKTSQV